MAMDSSPQHEQLVSHEVAAELAARFSSAGVQEHVQQRSPNAWKTSTTSDDALISFVVKFSAEESQQQQLQWLTREHQLFAHDTMAGNLTVVMSSTNTRVECNGKSIHGDDFIYITDEDSGFLFLDKTSKTFVHMPNDRKVRHAFREPITGEATVTRDEKHGATLAEISIAAPLSLKYVLELNPDDTWAPFRGDIASILIGCADQMGTAGLDIGPIIDAGVPVKGEVFMEQGGGQWQKMSSFTVSHLGPYDGKDDPFVIPAGYRDLRDVDRSSKGGKGKPFGPAVRLSEYRERINLQPGPAPFLGNDAPDRTVYAAREAGGLGFPACLDETYGALLANLVDEKMLDDLKYVANLVSKRLTGFSGSGGNIAITWMDQFKAQAAALTSSDPGGGLYDLLHDEEATSTSHPQKLGMLDKLAVSSLSKLLASGDALTNLSLSSTLQAAVNAVLTDTTVAPEDRFSQLAVDQQGLLVDAYVFNGIGTLDLTYPSTTGTQTIFYGLINVRLDDIKFDIKISNQEIISTFDFDSNSVHLAVMLPDASGEAWLARWPTLEYWAVVGISSIACFLFPFTCFLMDMAVLVGIFIALDLAFVTLDLANLSVDSHIRLVPNASNVLEPDVDLTLDADVSAFYLSVLPTGIHQILSLIYTIVLDATNLVINEIQSQLKDGLNKYLKDDLKITYPPAFGPVPLVGISNSVEFVADDRGYVEQQLNAGLMSVINPYITQIDSDVKPNILTLREQYKAEFTDPVAAFTAAGSLLAWASADLSKVARYYLGTVLSQNFINDYIYVLWRQLLFNYNFSTAETQDLLSFLRAAFPHFFTGPATKKETAHLWPAVPPRTLFTPKPASEGKFYATTFFDDVRICFELPRQHGAKSPNVMEFSFAGQAVTELGFGGFNATTGKLDLLKLSDRVFDIYFDLASVGVTVIHPEVQYFAYPGMVPEVTFDYSPLNSLQEMFRRGLSYSLTSRNSSFIPRSPGDPKYIQRYPLGTDAVQVIFQLVPFRGNLYVSKGLSGKATAMYQGAADIDTMNKITADLIRALV
jgi:hypothetical protein